METDNHSSTSGSFEHVETDESSVDRQQTQKPTKNRIENKANSMPTCCLLNNLNWPTTTMNSIVEKLQSEFRVEIGAVKLLAKLGSMELKMKVAADQLETMSAVKTENKMLAAKVDALQAQNGELLARLEVVELEAKQLANKQQMAKTVRAKVADRLKNKMQENKQKFTEWQAESDKKKETRLGNIVKKSSTTDLGENMAALANDQPKSMWSENRWESSSNIFYGQEHVLRLSAGGLIAAKTTHNIFYANIRAKLPVSLGMLASLPFRGDLPIVYYEVQQQLTSVSNPPYSIGWTAGSENCSLLDRSWIGNQPGSYGISWDGDYWESGSRRQIGNTDGFKNGDLMGTGLFMRDGRLKLFFTKNGLLNGKPIPLEANQLLLYPAVSLSRKDASMEANFGADPRKKPFKFDINAHKALLWLNSH